MSDMSESVKVAPADHRGRSDQDEKTGWDPLPCSLHHREILCPEGHHGCLCIYGPQAVAATPVIRIAVPVVFRKQPQAA